MSMYFIYHSMTGMVNLVFTAALLALTLQNGDLQETYSVSVWF